MPSAPSGRYAQAGGMRLDDADKRETTPNRGEIAVERVDRLAEWLQGTLGTRLTAVAPRPTPRELVRIAHGDREPGPDEEQRLRNLYAVASMLASRDGAGSAYAFLTEPNEELGGRTPASLLPDR